MPMLCFKHPQWHQLRLITERKSANLWPYESRDISRFQCIIRAEKTATCSMHDLVLCAKVGTELKLKQKMFLFVLYHEKDSVRAGRYVHYHTDFIALGSFPIADFVYHRYGNLGDKISIKVVEHFRSYFHPPLDVQCHQWKQPGRRKKKRRNAQDENR